MFFMLQPLVSIFAKTSISCGNEHAFPL